MSYRTVVMEAEDKGEEEWPGCVATIDPQNGELTIIDQQCEVVTVYYETEWVTVKTEVVE